VLAEKILYNTAFDKNELDIKFNDLLTENIKKGWEKI